MAAVIDEIPEKVPEADPKNDEIKDDVEAKEREDCFDDDVFLLNRTMSKMSFLSPNSDSSEQKRKMVQNLKPNSLVFSEEETTYKPPKRKAQGNKQGKIQSIPYENMNHKS